MNLNRLFLLLIVLLTYQAKAQNHVLQFRIVDSLNSQNIHGSATLLMPTDSSFIRIAAFDNGMGKFEGLSKNTYTLKLQLIGYKDSMLLVKLDSSMNLDIPLFRRTTTFSNVKISTSKNTFTFTEGNIKTNIENSVLNTLPDAIEVLSKIPTVQVSNDRESITVIGKGSPLLYLGNQRITLNDLSLISVNDIKSIEVILNPSSKYESDGRAVILITRKISKGNSSKLDINETAAQKRLFENRFSINGNFKSNKNEWRTNLQIYHINRWEGLDGKLISDARNYNSGFDGTSIGLRRQLVGGLGYYRQINDNDYFSFNVSGRLQDEVPYIQTNSFEQQHLNYTTYQTKADNFQVRPYINSTLNYEKKLKHNAGKIFFGSQASYYAREFTNDIYNNIQNTGFNLSENRHQKFGINVYSARLDYETNIRKHLKLEVGLMGNYATSFTDFKIDSSNIINKLNARYHYEEWNQAAYTQASGKFKKVKWSAGVRFENTDLNGGETYSNIELLKRQFSNLMPRANISFPIDSLKTLTINYANYLVRPDYSNLNQTTNYITPFLDRANNLFINPSKIQEVAFVYQYKTYNLTASFNYTKDPVFYITDTFQSNGTIRIINRNLSQTRGANIGINIPLDYKKYSSVNTISTIYNQIQDNRYKELKTAPYLYVQSNNQFKLKRNWTIAIVAWYTSKKYEGLFEHNSQYAVDVIVSKKIKNKLSITLNALDIFRSLNYRETFNINGIYSDITYFENVRELSLSLRYSIGNLSALKFKNRDVIEGRRIN